MLIGLHVWLIGLAAGPLYYFAAETPKEKTEATCMWIGLWCVLLIPLICALIFK